MASQISTIETLARRHLLETSANFWTSPELVDLCIAGIRDLWRDTVDLKQEHYLTIDNTNVTLEASSSQLSGVPTDVHKVYLIEPRTVSAGSVNEGLTFEPRDYNDKRFISARTLAAVDPANSLIYYAITGQGAPVGAPIIRVSPQVTSRVQISFCYVPTVGQLTSSSVIPIPGEADNALTAWVVAYARAKEREDRSPDPAWLSIYSTEKQHLLESLGVRQYQEAQYVNAMFEEYWS